jgi:hypothetical protein
MSEYYWTARSESFCHGWNYSIPVSLFVFTFSFFVERSVDMESLSSYVSWPRAGFRASYPGPG